MNRLDHNAIESKAAEHISRYFDCLAHRDDEITEDRRRWMCSAVSRLLDSLLASDGRWSKERWIDDLITDNIEVSAPRLIELRGAIWWGVGGTTEQWTDPFAARFVSSDQGSLLESYEIRFVDAKGDAIERGSFDSQKHPFPEKDGWRLVFTKGQVLSNGTERMTLRWSTATLSFSTTVSAISIRSRALARR